MQSAPVQRLAKPLSREADVVARHAARLHLQTDFRTEQLANPMAPRRGAFHWLDRLAARAAGVGSRC